MVSVITTLYNYRKFITEAIISFKQQDFADSEMIIVDDASVDDPYQVIKPYISNKIKYIRLDINRGYSHAKNVGISASSGDLLVMLDADDMLTKDGISIRYNKIMEGYDFVHGPSLDLKNGITTRTKMWGQWLGTKSYKYVHAQGVMLKKSIHSKIGLYDENLWCKSDREMFARIFNHNFKIGFVDKDVSIYRHHDRQMHKSKKKLAVNDQLQQQLKNLINKRKKDLSGLEMLI